MSGGGGTGGVGPVGPSERLDCQALEFDTTLSSPNQDVAENLQVSDMLDLQIQDAGGRKIIAAVSRPGAQVAGAITERTADLLRCMQQQVAYEAVITSIDGGWIELRVRPR